MTAVTSPAVRPTDVPARALDAIVSRLDEGIVLVDPSLGVRFSGGRLLDPWPAAASLLDLVHPDDRALAARSVARTLAIPGEAHTFEVRIVDQDGTVCWVEATASNLLEDERVGAVLVVLRAQLDRSASGASTVEVALRASEERFRVLAEAVPTGVFELSPRGRFTFVNRRFAELVGRPELADDSSASSSALVRAELVDLVQADDLPDFMQAWHKALTTDGQLATTFRVRSDRADGTERRSEARWVTIRTTRVMDESGAVSAFVGSLEDLSKEISLQKQLSHRANHDALTGLPNRAYLFERLGVALTAEHPRHTVALLVDLDHFKAVNDQLGHTMGDSVLREAANRLRNAVRPTDVVGRMGADEFLVICTGVQLAESAKDIAERLRVLLTGPAWIDGQQVFLSASIGAAIQPPLDEEEHDLLDERVTRLIAQADAAAYEAKRKGRSRSEVFHDALAARVTSRHDLAAALEEAIERDQIDVVYQPVFRLNDMSVAMVEAFARWHHVERGAVPPGVFIPAAESNGLIGALGKSVLRRALREIVGLRELSSGLTVNVNVSALQLADAAFIDLVLDELEDAGLPGDALGFEITEGVLAEDHPAVHEGLIRLQGAGVRLSVDDFGTGYSSITYLRRFPIDYVKIDGQFLKEVGTTTSGPDGVEGDETVVRAVVELAHSLGIPTVAEGIEHPEQLDRLHALGCDLGQGYLLGSPVGFSDMRAQLAARGSRATPATH